MQRWTLQTYTSTIPVWTAGRPLGKAPTCKFLSRFTVICLQGSLYTRHFANWIRVVAASEVSIVLRFSCFWSGYYRRGKLFLLTTLYNTDSCACHIFGVYKSYRYSFSSIPLKWACSVTFLTSLFLSIVHPTAGRTEHLQDAFHDSTTNPGDIALAFYIGGWAYDGWWMRAVKVLSGTGNKNASIEKEYDGAGGTVMVLL